MGAQVLLFVLIALVAALAGAGLAVLLTRRAQRRADRYLDQEAAARVAYFAPCKPAKKRRR